ATRWTTGHQTLLFQNREKLPLPNLCATVYRQPYLYRLYFRSDAWQQRTNITWRLAQDGVKSFWLLPTTIPLLLSMMGARWATIPYDIGCIGITTNSQMHTAYSTFAPLNVTILSTPIRPFPLTLRQSY